MRVPGVGVAPVALPRRWLPIAILVLLGVIVGVLVHGAAGLGLIVLGLLLLARPFEPFTAFVLVAAACAFVEYGDPHLQRDLAIVLLLTVYAMVSLLAAALTNRWRFPVSRLTTALVALAVTSAIGAVHGLLAHTTFRFNVLELFPIATLYVALAVGGLRVRAQELPFATGVFVAAALANSMIGFQYYAETGMRTQGLPFSPFPGFVALLLLAQTLFDSSPRPRLLPIVAMCILLLHQVATFTRGYWFGLLLGIPVTCLLYARWGEGSWPRWRKVWRTVALAALVTLPAVVVASAMLGWSELVGMLGSRFASSFETKNTPETLSNIVRLVELRTTMGKIASSPLFGFGHGATLLVRQFFYPMAGEQWWVHQSYVMMWFKQGLIGLFALLWVIHAGIRTGVVGCRNQDPRLAGWSAGCAGCTVFVAVVGLTNFTFFMTTLTAILGLVWGVTISAQHPVRSRWVWRLTGEARLPEGDGAAPPA